MIIECSSCGTANRVPAARLTDAARCGACKSSLAPPRKPLAVRAAADLAELIANAPVPVLLDFWAPWCGPCLTLAPQLEMLAKRNAGAVVVAKLNSDDFPELAARYGIRAIPTMIVFTGGREKRRMSGAMSADAIERAAAL